MLRTQNIDRVSRLYWTCLWTPMDLMHSQMFSATFQLLRPIGIMLESLNFNSLAQAW